MFYENHQYNSGNRPNKSLCFVSLQRIETACWILQQWKLLIVCDVLDINSFNDCDEKVDQFGNTVIV